MPIFRYTFKKILSSPSTWVIFSLTLFILGLSWALPVGFVTSQTKVVWTKELALEVFLPSWKLLAFNSFIGLMLLIFIGVKATQIFRDEIDDGTLLILVSKPISRNRIWFEKWFSFQATVILYVFSIIFLDGLLLLMPAIGNRVIYAAFFPYMWILFGITLLFDLIFTSVVLLLSLVLNSKATIALTVGFAALVNIFSQGIDSLVSIPASYFQISHAVTVYHDVERKLSIDDFNWFKGQLTNSNYKGDIDVIIKKVYKNDIKDVDYVIEYDPFQEQEVFNAIIADPSKYSSYSEEEIMLIKYIVNISNVFRQWKEQSYQELMTSEQVGSEWSRQPHGNATPGNNGVNYGAYDVIEGIQTVINKETYELFTNKISKKRNMRYFNVFYQLYYLWNGVWKEESSLYISDRQYQEFDDPNLISFKNIDERNYQVNLESNSKKILNFSVLITFYIILGIALLILNWYIFNHRDFA